jgi:hypothetical protein
MSDLNDKLELAKCIEEAFREEFKIVHLAKNLVNTMKIEVVDGVVTIDIPAMKYNMKKFRETGIIKYYYRGSYAEQINNTGGLSGKHEGYIEKCIETGVSKWLQQKGVSGKVTFNE